MRPRPAMPAPAQPAEPAPTSERTWAETFDLIPDAIALCDGAGRVVRGNLALHEVLGRSVEEVRQRPVDEALAPLRLAAAVDEAMSSGQVVRCDEAPPGGRTYSVTISPLTRDPAGGQGAVVLLRDVTSERRMQRRLILGERMAAVGQLVAGLAHEINNPVSFAFSNLELAREALASGRAQLHAELAEVPEMLDEVLIGLSRVRDIVRDLRTFTSTEVRNLSSQVYLDDLLDLAVRLTRSEVQGRARLVYERDLNPTPPIRGDAGTLSHVLLNLLGQALHNLPPPGEEGGAEHAITVRTRVDGGRGVVELLVADTGPTLSEEARAHLFEPFAQRRARLPPHMSAAIGMGLAVSYEVVRRHGGEIEARPAAPGNELWITLPLATAASSE